MALLGSTFAGSQILVSASGNAKPSGITPTTTRGTALAITVLPMMSRSSWKRVRHIDSLRMAALGPFGRSSSIVNERDRGRGDPRRRDALRGVGALVGPDIGVSSSIEADVGDLAGEALVGEV